MTLNDVIGSDESIPSR